ncbi:MAG: YceI family protein [Acidobacteria bacterium]|nr:YceI family protein [Acidobacteriota bacterium]
MKTVLIVTMLASAASCAAQVQNWQIDPAHSASQFSVRHMGISTVRGVFEKTSGTVLYDPADPAKTQVDVSIEAASVNTRVQMRDNDLRSPNFLDVAKYPTITFKSKRTEVVGTGKLRMVGDLTIHGVSKEVTLEVEGPSEIVNDPRGTSHMGAEATTKINRKEFGVNGAAAVVGDEITIILDVEMKRPTAAK